MVGLEWMTVEGKNNISTLILNLYGWSKNERKIRIIADF